MLSNSKLEYQMCNTFIYKRCSSLHAMFHYQQTYLQSNIHFNCSEKKVALRSWFKSRKDIWRLSRLSVKHRVDIHTAWFALKSDSIALKKVALEFKMRHLEVPLSLSMMDLLEGPVQETYLKHRVDCTYVDISIPISLYLPSLVCTQIKWAQPLSDSLILTSGWVAYNFTLCRNLSF